MTRSVLNRIRDCLYWEVLKRMHTEETLCASYGENRTRK
jgi:hypothetical protein